MYNVCYRIFRSHSETSLLSEGFRPMCREGSLSCNICWGKDLSFEVSFKGLSQFTYLFETLTQILLMRYMTQRFIKVVVAHVCAYRSLCKFAERKHPLNFIFISQNGLQWIQVYLFTIFLSVRLFPAFFLKVDQLVTQYIYFASFSLLP